MMHKVIPIVAAALLLTACQQAPVRGEDSPYSRVAPGSSIILHEPLIVPLAHTRVFMQAGKVKAKTDLDRYRPHCNFEVRSVSNGNLRIEPDTFLVTAISVDEEEVVSRQEPLRLAAWRMTGWVDSPALLNLFVRHRLYSQRQPQVMRLTCHGGFDEAWKANYPSISDIRQALGKLATVTLASEKD